MDSLTLFTFIINYAAFFVVLWLGLYIILHNPKYLISWLTAFTLWSLATLFLHYLLEPAVWPHDVVAVSSNRLFQGLAVAPALAFWHHVTMLMRPGRLTFWRMFRILAAYVLAAAAVVLQTTSQIWTRQPGSDLLFLNTRQSGPLYPLFAAALLLFITASMINLLRSARATNAILPRKQLITLAWATLVAGLTGPVMIVAMIIGLPIPTLVNSLLLAATVGLIGYGVARYSALVEGRTIARDFFYNLIIVVLIGAIYITAGWMLIQIYRAPPIVFLLIPVLAVFTHSLVNPAYRLLDMFLLHRETRQLRSDLRRLSRLAFEEDVLGANLEQAFRNLCISVHASFGFVLTFEGESIQVTTRYRWLSETLDIPPDCLKSDDVIHLLPGQLPPPLEGASLLVPLCRENDQFGALLLGHPLNGTRFAPEDVEQILNPAEMIGEAMHRAILQREMMSQVAKLADTQLPERVNHLPIGLVEDALRNLYDYTFLADSPLANLSVVQFRLPHGSITHLERGKVVNEVLLEIINKLNPGKSVLRDPPPREWYPYIILKEAYVDEVSNRDIMMHLYISEGTFNRTRRAAIRSIARALEEMESSLH